MSGEKTFAGIDRWERFNAWHAELPQGARLVSIGTWVVEGDEYPTLFIEYADPPLPEKAPSVCPCCKRPFRRRNS